MAKKYSRRDIIWIIPTAAAAGFFGWFGWRTARIQLLKHPAGKPKWWDGSRLRVADISELSELWSYKYFVYPTQFGPLPSVLIRVPHTDPGGINRPDIHLIGLSRICTHMGCTVNYIDDPKLGSMAYKYNPGYPFLGCPCHFSAFNPQDAGDVVFGPADYPLPRIRLELDGAEVYATGHEVPLRPIQQ